MGMFDYFKIDYPLPLALYILAEYRPYVNAVIDQDEFQSKSLECCLTRYYIDNNGHIFIDESSFEDKNFEPAMRQIYYHGHIMVHAFIPLQNWEIDNSRKIWLEYDLKFTDSLLVSATMISPTEEEMNELHRNI